MSTRMLDYLVLTAAHAAQARGYTAQLADRRAAGLLDHVDQTLVVPDPGDRRVGSGGSTLWVLYEIARDRFERVGGRSLRELFTGIRIVVIHSGGDSKRLFAYAAQGKVFTPLPCDVPGSSPKHPATLFDLMQADLAALDTPETGHVLLAAGDVLLTFSHDDVDFHRSGVVGVAYPGPVERGGKHGVYVTDGPGSGPAIDFLQKPTPDVARERGAVDSVGRVLVDTGLIGLDPATVEKLLQSAGVTMHRSQGPTLGPGILQDLLDGDCPPIDLYEQMLSALPKKITRKRYLEAMRRSDTGAAEDPRHLDRLARLHDALHKLPLHVSVLSYCEFFHIGSHRELLGNVSTLGRTAKLYGFAHGSRAVVADRAATEGAFIYNSRIASEQTQVGGGVLLEAVHTTRDLVLDGANIVVGLPPGKTPLHLPERLGIVCLPVDEKAWSAALFGIDDDFKTPRSRGGTFLNQPLDALVESLQLPVNGVWETDDPQRQTLWNARLWPVGTIDAVLKRLLWMTRTPSSSAARTALLRGERLTAPELLARVDHDRLLEHRREIQRIVALHRLGRAVQRDPMLPALRIVEQIRAAGEVDVALDKLAPRLDAAEPALGRARAHWLAAEIASSRPAGKAQHAAADGHRRAAFAAVAEAVAREVPRPAPASPVAILPDQVVWVTVPVRIDFAGGWSDTPPICNEQGGAVVNTAITLNRQYPVQCMAKLADEPRIRLSSIDLGASVTYSRTTDIVGDLDPRTWDALPKAALRLAGFCPEDPKASLAKHLEKLGGGLDLTVFSALPKGSGLGTSSVLGAAMLACLARVRGETVTDTQLIARTSLLEQLMTTAGGWQDQLGAILPGIKIARTQPGIDQTPTVAWTHLDLDRHLDLQQRTLLYFTGIKRMARDILQKVVGRYLAREPQTMDIIARLKAGAEQMKLDLDAGDHMGFARGVDEYWQLKRSIDPGATNPQIEALLQPINGKLDARLLPGAGGGGFVFMIAKDPAAAADIRRDLEKRPPNPHARFFDFAVDHQGLNVTVL